VLKITVSVYRATKPPTETVEVEWNAEW